MRLTAAEVMSAENCWSLNTVRPSLRVSWNQSRHVTRLPVQLWKSASRSHSQQSRTVRKACNVSKPHSPQSLPPRMYLPTQSPDSAASWESKEALLVFDKSKEAGRRRPRQRAAPYLNVLRPTCAHAAASPRFDGSVGAGRDLSA